MFYLLIILQNWVFFRSDMVSKYQFDKIDHQSFFGSIFFPKLIKFYSY